MINKTCSLFLNAILYVATGQDCDNVCYRNVKDGLKHLEELYSKPPTISNVPPMYDDIKSLINRTENIISSIKTLDDVKNKYLSTQENIFRGLKGLSILKHILTDIGAINKTLQDLQHKKEGHIKAFNECDKASTLYNTLKEDVRTIREYGAGISSAFDAITNRIDEIKNRSLAIKNDLDSTNISDALFQRYLCDSRLQTTIKDVINIMKTIADKLKALFKEIIAAKLKELEYNITEYEKTIKEIEQSLGEKLPETDVKITGQTRPHLEDLKAQVDDLKNKIKEIKLDNTIEHILDDGKQKLKALINEYEIILNHIFSEETKKNVKEEIEKAKQTLNLLKEKQALKAELEDIKKIVDTLKDRGVCFINETVSVEDKI